MIRSKAVLLLVFGLACGGCGGGDRPQVYSVSGTIIYKDKPVEGATVNFYTEGSPRVAGGVTDAAGKFELTTFDTGDGAVAGDHIVTVSKQVLKEEITSANAETGGEAYDTAMRSAMKNNYKDMSTDQLPAKYAGRDTSGIKRTVVPGEANEFTIKLE